MTEDRYSCNVSIVVVGFNTGDVLAACLNSIYANTQSVKYEVLVIDNASEDGSVEYLKRSFPDVRVICNRENVGFSRACNQGFRESSGEYVFFLNPDTVLLNDAAQEMYSFMGQPENHAVFACGGSLFHTDGSPGVSWGNLPSLQEELIWALRLDYLLPPASVRSFASARRVTEAVPFDVDFISGADLFLRRSAFATTAPFDEDFFLYFEDTELCCRMRRAGHRAVIVPAARIKHHHACSSEGREERRIHLFEQSRLLYFAKCLGRKCAERVHAINRIGSVFRVKLRGNMRDKCLYKFYGEPLDYHLRAIRQVARPE